MKNIQFTNLTIFIIFFGIALIEALQQQDWFMAGIFLVLGIAFLHADIKGLRKHK